MLIDTNEYLSMVSRYIHLNPIRAVEYSNIINGLEISNQIVEQSLLGSESFIEWIKKEKGLIR